MKRCDCGQLLIAGKCPPCDAIDAIRKQRRSPEARQRDKARKDQAAAEKLTTDERRLMGSTVAALDPLYAYGRARGQLGAARKYRR